MEDTIARHVIRAVFRSETELENLIPLLKDQCTPEEYKTYARAIAAAIDGINTNVLKKVLASHPALPGAIDADIAKYGRLL
ncbi:MAG: hypothetical protein QOJ96_3539 [Alphaproteobacteria bacterium]|jgi:fibrillarin-like rRNA methylase|nr:hypothetical protein [Alphaproteobacteria bacterium]